MNGMNQRANSMIYRLFLRTCETHNNDLGIMRKISEQALADMEQPNSVKLCYFVEISFIK